MTDFTHLRSERELAAEILAAVRTLREVFGECPIPDNYGLVSEQTASETRTRIVWRSDVCPKDWEIAFIPSRWDFTYTSALLAELWRLRANRAARKGAAA